MKTYLKKIPWNALFVVLFLVFLGIFSFCRAMVAEQAVWLLAVTQEISLANVRKGDGEPDSAALKIVTSRKLKVEDKNNAASTSKDSSDMFKNPVTADLPKTPTPEIKLMEYFPEWNDPELTLFAPLRKFDGTDWNKEKTEIKAATNGKMLFLSCRLYDNDFAAAVTENTAGNKNDPWKDDSLEIFLMKDRESDFYCQYILAITGKGAVHYYKNGESPNRGSVQKLPAGFSGPRYLVNPFENGVEMEISIALSNIGIAHLKPEDSFLLQIVRNYHGQGYKDSVLLHLFPVYIYADKRLGASNHDRRAFQKVSVKK